MTLLGGKTRWNMVDGQKPQTLLETLNVTNQDLYPNIYAIFILLITMPVSSASSERSFSVMRRVKNCLRATMGDERLSNLSLLHIHRIRNLSIEDVINKFAARKKQTSGLYLITSPCCWTWWLHVLTWTLKLYSLNVSGNVSFIHFAFMLNFYSPTPPEGGILFYLCPSFQDIFRRIFLNNYWWQKSDICSQASYRYAILWEAILDQSNSYFLFADLVGFYAHWTYTRVYHKWALAHSSSCCNC
jgi:hypothetical protein